MTHMDPIDNPEVSGFDFDSVFGSGKTPEATLSLSSYLTPADEAPKAGTHQSLLDGTLDETLYQVTGLLLPGERTNVPFVKGEDKAAPQLPTKPTCNHHKDAKKTEPAKKPCSHHADSTPPDTFKRRRTFAKTAGMLLLAYLGVQMLSGWAASSTLSPTAATSVAGAAQTQISNVEMVTADASLHREYAAVQITKLRGNSMNSYAPTPGFGIVLDGTKVAIVTTIGSHCWVLFADGSRVAVRQEDKACQAGATALLRSELRAGF